MQDAQGNYHAFRSSILFSLLDWREVTSAGAVGNQATAAGGVLASDTTPIMGAEATSEIMSLAWAAGNADILQTSKSLPEEFDGRDDVLLELWVRTDNAGGGGIEAATFNVLTSWDGGAQVTDVATDSVPSETFHKITARIAAADIPDRPTFLNIQIFPDTHANDPVRAAAVRLTYFNRVQEP
jgi:hypothetical protein